MTIEYSNDEERLTLKEALLIYRDGDNNSKKSVVTRHEVSGGVIQVGQPVDLASIQKLFESKDTTVTKDGNWTWQFPRLLGETPDWVLWWSIPHVRDVFIGSDGRKPKVIQAWHPAFAWCAHRKSNTCYLWAYDGGDAPTKTTDVFLPRFGPADQNHIHANASICVGSSVLESNTPAAWEKAFWNSRFKVPGPNLKSIKPYACNKAFKKLGSLQSVLPRSSSAY